MKVPATEENEEFSHEIAILDDRGREPRCGNIVQSFFRLPDVNFMAFYGGGTLEKRRRVRQIRHEMHYDQVVSVERKQPVRLVHQWMRELCSASAWLELRNCAHNDIRPENLLLDGKDHLKLADFGSACQYRSILEGERPPYVRWHSVEVSDEDNSLGTVGPSSEQFAVGSTIYCVIEGHEVYGNEWFGEEYLVEVVERLQQKKFPALNRSAVSNIIHDCWHGSFDTIKQLLASVRNGWIARSMK